MHSDREVAPDAGGRPSLRSFTRLMCGVAVMLLTGVCPVAGQDELSDAEKARLAASDGGAGEGQTVGPEIALPFHEPFDGSELSGQWSVQGQDKDQYVLENGAVFVVQSGGKAHPANETTDNLFTLDGTLPDVDFDMSLKVRLDAKTGYEDVWIGLFGDKDNYLAANLSVYTKGCGASLYLRIENRRVLSPDAKPGASAFTSNLLDGPIIDNLCSKSQRPVADKIIAGLNTTGLTLTLSRRGFRYFASVDLDVPSDIEQPEEGTLRTFAVSRLAAFGRPFFLLGQSSKAGSGETTALIEDLAIVAAE